MLQFLVAILLLSSVATSAYIYVRGEGLVGAGGFLLFWALWSSLAIVSSYLVVSSVKSDTGNKVAGVISILFSLLTFVASSPFGLMTVLWILVLPTAIAFSVSAIVLSVIKK